MASACLLPIVIAAGGQSALADNLMDAMIQAYTTNPFLEQSRTSQKAIDEQAAQANSGWRPTVSLSGTAGRARTENSLTGGGEVDLDPRTWSATVSQNLYSGGQTIAASGAAEANILSGRENLKSAEQIILLQTVTSYMDVMRDIAVLELNRNNEDVLAKQLEASQDRFRVGEITRTDVAQSEARLALAKANTTAAEAQLILSQSAYERVVGTKPGSLEQPPELPAMPASEDEARNIAVESNPTLRAAVYSEEAANYTVDRQFGRLLPTLDLQAEVSHSEETSSRTSETDTKSITAQLRVPLYQSGAQYSAIRQAKAQASQARLGIAQTERETLEGVNNAWEALRSSRSRIVSARAAVKANEIALDGVRQEAAVGSRTTLDVLDAEQELLDSRVTLVRSERDEYVAAYSLLSAIGRLTVQDLGLPIEPYDPAVNADKVRWQHFGLD